MPTKRTKTGREQLAAIERQNHIAACIASALAMMDEAGVPYSITIGKGEIRK